MLIYLHNYYYFFIQYSYHPFRPSFDQPDFVEPGYVLGLGLGLLLGLVLVLGLVLGLELELELVIVSELVSASLNDQ